ncbi:MAG: two-component system response regulator CreB [Oligoflexia bacterium]|nr:two-component system response regulator CreB [Oligoflexia bacterium]
MPSVRQLILIVEDEPAIADMISYALSTEGFEPLWCATGGEAQARFEERPIALAILDVGLPDISGFELFKKLRVIRDLPVIFLTARADEIDRVLGLELGADDYVLKPFSPRELSARVKNVLRRTQAAVEITSAPKSTPTGPFTVDAARMLITYFGKELELSRYEYKLLKLLSEHPGRVYTREQLMALVWDEPDSSLERTVDAHIKQLRSKLRAITSQHDPIITHRGTGYSLKEDW